jgi:hypothetical protein
MGDPDVADDASFHWQLQLSALRHAAYRRLARPVAM